MSSTINASVDGIVLTASSTAAMNLATGGTNRLSIDTSGNVGIATGNLSFSATGQRITGDMSNATHANRLGFQTSTANAGTTISAFPNGTGGVSQLNLYANPDPTNASLAQFIVVDTADVRLNSNRLGTGTYLPITFYTGGSERMRLDTSGNLGIGTASPVAKLDIISGTARVYVSNQSDTGFITAVNTTNTAYAPLAINGSSVIVKTGDAARMTVDSSGNVGIGIASPAGRLHARFDAGAADGYTGKYIFQTTDQRLTIGTYWQSGVGQYARIQSSTDSGSPIALLLNPDGGNVSVGTTSSSVRFTVSGTGEIVHFVNPSGANLYQRWFNTGATYTPYIGTESENIVFGHWGLSERMRITSGGLVGIGTASPNVALEVASIASENSRSLRVAYDTTYYYEIRNLGAAGNRIRSNNGSMTFNITGTDYAVLTTGGEFITGGTTDQGAYNLQCNGTGVWGAGAYVNGSDERLKDNIQSLDAGLDVVKAMRPVTFQYKPEYSKDQSIQPGFIAQELQTAMAGKSYLEGVVQEGSNHLNVAYQNIIPILVKAIQELEAKVAALESK